MNQIKLDSGIPHESPSTRLGIKLPDPDDRHVLAAAIVCKASCIVTFNKKDFPDDALEPYGLHVVHPDDFLLDVESIEPASFARAVGADFGHYVNPKLPFEDYVGSLRMSGVPKTAEKVGRLAVLFTAMP